MAYRQMLASIKEKINETMNNMEIFQIVSGIASILGFIITLVVLNKVNKIEMINKESMQNTQQNNNTVSGDNAGRDINKNV